MAQQKFTLEEILNEYSADGKRSGIRREDDTPLSHGTLETEKLVNAATSRRPMQENRAGYRTITEADSPADGEELVDIKYTISQIKAAKTAHEIHSQAGSPLLQERFPTQHLRRSSVSFINAANAASRGAYGESGEDSYDGAVKLTVPEAESEALHNEKHQPNIRQMENSTRAKEKKRGRRRHTADNSYTKESVTGVFAKPVTGKTEKMPASRRHWDEEENFYYQGGGETGTLRSMRQRVRSHAGWNDEKRTPDDMEAAKKLLCNLRNVIFFRFVSLLFLTLLSSIFAFFEAGLMHALTPRGFAAAELILGAAAAAIAFPTVRNGLKNFCRFHADSDSMAVLPMLPAMVNALLAVIQPDVLGETVHLFLPCAVFALFLNAVGRLLVVRRALRSCNVLSKEGQKRVLSYVSQEETAELLTRGVIHDYPIVTAVRRANSLCDFLRYTYSNDMADALCRPLSPICAGIALVASVGITLIRMGLSLQFLWFSFLLTNMTIILTAGCCIASALVVNLPLERESKKAAEADGVMLGYQSVDDFFDTNALLTEAADLFPKGSVQIQGMKIMGGAKVDDVLLDAASLVHHAGSILSSGFDEMIPDSKSLYPVEQFVCEDGLGLCGWIANRRVLLGGREMMAGHNIDGLPTKTREAEMTDGSGDVVYLSVSGVLSAIFSIRITADNKVKRQMQSLKQEQIALIIRSVDSSVTLRRISALFNFPEQQLKIIPTSMHHLFQRETADLDCVSASTTIGSSGFGAARLLTGARRVRRAAMAGIIIQVVSALLGICLAAIHIVIGAYEELNAQFFLLYHLIMTIVTTLTVRLR